VKTVGRNRYACITLYSHEHSEEYIHALENSENEIQTWSTVTMPHKGNALNLVFIKIHFKYIHTYSK